MPRVSGWLAGAGTDNTHDSRHLDLGTLDGFTLVFPLRPDVMQPRIYCVEPERVHSARVQKFHSLRNRRLRWPTDPSSLVQWMCSLGQLFQRTKHIHCMYFPPLSVTESHATRCSTGSLNAWVFLCASPLRHDAAQCQG